MISFFTSSTFSRAIAMVAPVLMLLMLWHPSTVCSKTLQQTMGEGVGGGGLIEPSTANSVMLSSSKMWPKATLQQALRQIRGFRPQSLSTARGFGKRFDSQFVQPSPYWVNQYENHPNIFDTVTSSRSVPMTNGFDLRDLDNNSDALLLRYLLGSRHPSSLSMVEDSIKRADEESNGGQ